MKILLQHKIFIGYFLLMAIIGSMVAIVLHERNRVQKIENESIAIFQTQYDINAFNAGKKRDKALELIAAWLPDVEKFSKEISKQSAYIDSLKEQIGQESDYAGRMRDEKYEQELKVQKANQKIFELQRTNEQMGRLLSKIPPEVLEELQRTGRNKSRER